MGENEETVVHPPVPLKSSESSSSQAALTKTQPEIEVKAEVAPASEVETQPDVEVQTEVAPSVEVAPEGNSGKGKGKAPASQPEEGGVPLQSETAVDPPKPKRSALKEILAKRREKEAAAKKEE